jgi:hypothetical protein
VPVGVQVTLTTRLQVVDGTSLPCNVSMFLIPNEIVQVVFILLFIYCIYYFLIFIIIL